MGTVNQEEQLARIADALKSISTSLDSLDRTLEGCVSSNGNSHFPCIKGMSAQIKMPPDSANYQGASTAGAAQQYIIILHGIWQKGKRKLWIQEKYLRI